MSSHVVDFTGEAAVLCFAAFPGGAPVPLALYHLSIIREVAAFLSFVALIT